MGSVVGKVIVWAFVAVTMGACAAAPAAIMTEVAPETTAGAVEHVLCPPGTTARLITNYSTPTPDSDSTRQQTQTVRCYDANGTVQVGRGDRFADLWYGIWMLGGAGVATAGMIVYWLSQRAATKTTLAVH